MNECIELLNKTERYSEASMMAWMCDENVNGCVQQWTSRLKSQDKPKTASGISSPNKLERILQRILNKREDISAMTVSLM